MTTLRNKLFLSYSRADEAWRQLFRKHLGTVVAADELWVDDASIAPGTRWEDEIESGVSASRCALILLTPRYLDLSSFSRTELQRLLDEERRGLTLLPVLIEDCAWQHVEGLADTQMLRWPGDRWQVPTAAGERETIRPLVDEQQHLDAAVVQICEQVKKALGVVAQATSSQFDELAARVHHLLDIDGSLEPLHSGDFSVVYRATLGNEQVAIKALPDAPRRNRIRAIVDQALPALQRLTDPAFIRIRLAYTDAEPLCLVMDFVDWPTLDQRLAELPGRRLPPRQTAQLLACIARAQADAHANGLLIGPLSLSSVHVGPNWELRLSALRVEGVLARAASMSTGQLLNWDALTHLAPETSDGFQPATLEQRDALEQYYLGLFGLELLLGRKACEVRRFDDFARKSAFFERPRDFFAGDAAPGSPLWSDECPALAFVLAKMLARDPKQRFASTTQLVRELEAVADGTLPDSLLAQIDADLDTVLRPEFTAAFYERLFAQAPKLEPLFHHDRATQARMLADALQDLVSFDPRRPAHSRFGALAARHAGYGIGAADVLAFRECFVASVRAAFTDPALHADAWDAVLAQGLEVMAAQLPVR